MLAELMRLQHGIAIAGSHGKTTTTSLVAKVLQIAGFDPTAVIGGKVNHIGSNARLGRGKFLVAEADESDGSFLLLSPSIAVITNIDPEHLDYWKGGLPELQARFTDFANHLPFFGLLVACVDAEHVRAILPNVKRRVITYGIEHDADFTATQIVQERFLTKFCVHHAGRELGSITMRLVGRHNVQNALAAIAVGNELGIPFTQMKEALEKFSGVHRRFSLVGEANGITVIDDYGHHPTEIKAVLDATKGAFPNRRILVLFQPHRFSRTAHLLEDFANAFHNADSVAILDIYAAGEQNTFDISANSLVSAIQSTGHKDTRYTGTSESSIDFVLANVSPNDVVITLGAGNVTLVAPKILQGLMERPA
jgi:UDP-N-acetylmuramate--alanine ligase